MLDGSLFADAPRVIALVYFSDKKYELEKGARRRHNHLLRILGAGLRTG